MPSAFLGSAAPDTSNGYTPGHPAKCSCHYIRCGRIDQHFRSIPRTGSVLGKARKFPCFSFRRETSAASSSRYPLWYCRASPKKQGKKFPDERKKRFRRAERDDGNQGDRTEGLGNTCTPVVQWFTAGVSQVHASHFRARCGSGRKN